MLEIRAVVETNSSGLGPEFGLVSNLEDQDPSQKDRDRSWSRIWLRVRDRQSSRPRPDKWRHHWFFRLKKIFLELKFALKLFL